MKKVLFFAALMLCVNFVTNAQTDEPKIQFGVRAGLNISNFGGDAGDKDYGGYTKSLAGFHVGVIMDINVAQSFYIQPGLYLTSKGGKYSESDDEDIWKATARPLYLQLPVLASYRINLTDNAKWHVNVGPYVAVGLSGKVKETWEDRIDGDKETYKYDMFKKDKDGDYEYDAPFQRFDAGLTFGTGVSIDKFYVGVGYDLGLANIYNSDNKRENGDRYTARNRTFMVSLGYNF